MFAVIRTGGKQYKVMKDDVLDVERLDGDAGAKITYNFSRNLGIVISPQGDIAFSRKADLNTTNAWVWPVSVGLRVRF